MPPHPVIEDRAERTQSPLVLFAHGKESGPWGSKIRHLAAIAEKLGAQVMSPDYSDLDDPDERVARLLATPLPPHQGGLVLVGSSMGGYVSIVASQTLRPAGLFLMVPAVYLPGYQSPEPQPFARHICVVHGWRDDVVPPEHGIRFAARHAAELHVLDDGHRLKDSIEELGALFERFLVKVLSRDKDGVSE